MQAIGTESAPARGALEKSRALPSTIPIQYFFNSLPDAVVVVRANMPCFTFAAASDPFLRMIGRAREELLGRGLFELFPDNPADPNATGVRVLTDSLERVIRTRAADSMVLQRYDVATPKGVFEERWWSSSNTPLVDETGTVAWIMLRVEDVTERGRSEDALRKSEALLRTMFELLPVGVWIADADGQLIRHNPAAERLWGAAPHVSPDEYGQFKAWWANTGRPIAAHEWAMSRALSQGETAVGELVKIEGFDGSSKLILNSAMPLRDHDGRITGGIAVNEDVTHLQRVEEELRRAIASRDEVLRVVAHDLRSPLQAVLLHADLLGRISKEERVATVSEQIRRQAKRMQRLVADLLDMTRFDTGTFSLSCRPVPAGVVLSDIVETQVSMASAVGLDLQVDVYEDLPDLWTDPDRLQQVFENLVGNAVKFTRAPGRISIGAKPDGEKALLWVSDTGVGIAAESMPRLFDRFWKADQSDRRGTGLGLPIVKGIVEAHGGRIWAESQVGVGTTFFFTVPLARVTAAG